MKRTVITLMRQAVHTLETQWNIELEHLQFCQYNFNRIELLLENSRGTFEEEFEDDGTGHYTWRITTPRLSDGTREIIFVQLFHDYYDDPDFSVSVLYDRWDPSRNKVELGWDINFDENKKLFFIGLDDKKDFHTKRLWAYKFGKKWTK